MILNKRHNKHRKFLKRWKSMFIEQGKIQASTEYNKKLNMLDNEFDLAISQNQKTHDTHIKSLVRKEQEFARLCEDMQKLKDEIIIIRDNARMYEAEGLQHSKNLYAMLQDEKVKKFMSLNHDTDALRHVASKIEKETARII